MFRARVWGLRVLAQPAGSEVGLALPLVQASIGQWWSEGKPGV